MHDKPFNLLTAQICDAETGELIFNRELYVAVWGEKRHERSIDQNYWDYVHRYDIEPHNRFSKQALLLNKYQTSNVDYLDAWTYVVQLAYWLLFVASEEVDTVVEDWEKYLPQTKKALEGTTRKSVAMTRKGAKRLFLTFEQEAFLPKSQKNGKGRKKGQKQKPRVKHKVQKKAQTKARKSKTKLTNELML